MHVQRLTIIGVGLLGGSIGLAAKSAIKGCHVVGYGHRPQTLKAALEVGAIDEAAVSVAQSVASSDLVIICTPVGVVARMLDEMAPGLPNEATVTDVGSTKRSIVEHAERALPSGVHFVGSHPIAGSEKRGVEFARTDLFQQALCILTPTERTHPDALAKVDEFWRTLGMRTARLGPDEHDRLLAQVSHLPHVMAAALVSMQTEQGLQLCGKGFLDTTRVAGGDGALWRDILLDNRDHLKAGVAALQQQLERLVTLLDRGDGQTLREWLDSAAQRREQLLQRKLRELNPD